jgi:hypothetical protein
LDLDGQKHTQVPDPKHCVTGTIAVFECILIRMPRCCRVSDAQEELEVARARGELSRLMRQNDTLEQELEEMDKKIGLLVQNRISVQDVIADRKKGGDQIVSVSCG